MKRSDQSVAIYGILALTGIALVGLLVLLGMGREVPEGLLTGVVLGGITGVLGWARGGTYYQPDAEKIPAAPVEFETLGVPVTPVAIPPSQIVEELNLTGPDNHTQENSGGNG